MTEQTIPVVHLSDYLAGGTRQQAFIKTVGDALVDIGFFALDDHGIDMRQIEKAYAVAEEFFRKPTDFKRAYEVPGLNGQRGYTSFGREHAKDSAAPDLKEFWHSGQPETTDSAGRELYPANVWPDGMDEFRDGMLTLFTRLESCALSLLEACALYVDEPKDRFARIATHGNSILRVIHYPPVAADAHPASIRAAAHEDINLITLLCEATAGGLELLERNGTWRPIHALKGQIIVDAGDMLQNISNGFFKSTTHRVVNPGNSRDRRFSIPFFMHPRAEADLTPLASCIARTGGEAAFPAITAGDYLAQRLREIGLAKGT